MLLVRCLTTTKRGWHVSTHSNGAKRTLGSESWTGVKRLPMTVQKQWPRKFWSLAVRPPASHPRRKCMHKSNTVSCDGTWFLATTSSSSTTSSLGHQCYFFSFLYYYEIFIFDPLSYRTTCFSPHTHEIFWSCICTSIFPDSKYVQLHLHEKKINFENVWIPTHTLGSFFFARI